MRDIVHNFRFPLRQMYDWWANSLFSIIFGSWLLIFVGAISMHELSIGWGNANEVCVKADKENRFSKQCENEYLLALSSVHVLFDWSHSRVEVVLLVESKEIDDIPNAEKKDWNQSKDLWGVKQSSCGLGVLCDPWYTETACKQEWDEEDQAHKGVPPVEILVHEAPEVPHEKNHSNE